MLLYGFLHQRRPQKSAVFCSKTRRCGDVRFPLYKRLFSKSILPVFEQAFSVNNYNTRGCFCQEGKLLASGLFFLYGNLASRARSKTSGKRRGGGQFLNCPPPLFSVRPFIYNFYRVKTDINTMPFRSQIFAVFLFFYIHLQCEFIPIIYPYFIR